MKECDKHRRILLLSQSGEYEGLEAALKNLLNADPPSVIGDILHQKTGDGLLHVAARGGHVTCIQLLLDLGVGVDQRNLEFKTSLHEAAQCGHSEAVKLLLRTGAQVDSLKRADWTPLMLASTKQGNMESVRYCCHEK